MESREAIVYKYRGQRGIYIWTHRETGKQYVGSSKNLGNRINEYYRNSYLTTQINRGSVISRALLAHGHDAFSLTVVSLGPTLKDVANSESFSPDYVVLEQKYLDAQAMVYNMNRIASPAAYTPSASPINVGVNNPAYGLTGASSFVWDKTHTQALKDRWSEARGTYTFYVYDSITFALLQACYSSSALANFIQGVSKRFGVSLAKKLRSLNQPAAKYGNFIISVQELSREQLTVLEPKMMVKKVTAARNFPGKEIFGYNPATNEYKTWVSLERCTTDLTGKRFQNKKTVNLRLDKHILFHGFYLQTTNEWKHLKNDS